MSVVTLKGRFTVKDEINGRRAKCRLLLGLESRAGRVLESTARIEALRPLSGDLPKLRISHGSIQSHSFPRTTVSELANARSR